MEPTKEEIEYPVTVAGISWQDIQKGDVIPAAKLREAFEILYPNRVIPEDAFISLQVKEWLEKARNSIGQPLVFKQQNGDLVVLTDEQAVGYLNSQALAGLRKHRGHTRRMFTHVDADQLSQHGAAQLEVNQARHALIASAADGARRQAVKLLKSGAKLPRLTPPDM